MHLPHQPGQPAQVLEMQGATPMPPQKQLTGMAQEAAQHLGRAHMEGTDQAWQDALSFLDTAIAAEPDNAALHTMLGRLHIAQAVQVELRGEVPKPPPAALDALLRAIELDPDDPDPRRGLVQLHLLSGRPERALEASRALLERRPDELMQHAKMGQALLAMGELDQAQERFRQAADLGDAAGDIDTWVRAMDGLGDVHRARGEQAGMGVVIEALEQARAQGLVTSGSPSASCVFASLGDLYKATGSAGEAAERYAAAADVESTNLGHQLEAARLLLEHDHPVRALLYLERGMGMLGESGYGELTQAVHTRLRDQGQVDLLESPATATAATSLALAAFDAGSIPQARLQAERAERLDPDIRREALLGLIYLLESKPGLAELVFEEAQREPEARAMAEVGFAHVALGRQDYPRATGLLAAVADRPAPARPDGAWDELEAGFAWTSWRMAVLGQAWIASNQGLHDQALAAYDRILEHHPDDPLALLGRGNSLTAQGRLDEATAPLERVLAMDPTNRYALTGMGLVHHNRGQHDQAEQLFQQALEQDSTGYTCPYEGLGLVYLAQGRDDDAEQAFQRAIDIAPNIEYLKYNGLARIYIKRGELDEAERLLRLSMNHAPHDP